MRGKKGESRSVKCQGKDALHQMFQKGVGTSKHKDKICSIKKSADRKFDYQNSDCKNKIYSSQTLKTYEQGWERYCANMKQDGFKVNGHSPRTFEDASQYMPRYLEKLKSEGKSAWTIGTYFSGPAKVMGLSRSDYELPSRNYTHCTRSRNVSSADSHFNPDNHVEIVQFCRCTGLRKSELKALSGTQLGQYKDGVYYLSIKGKGGRERRATIIGTDEQIQQVVGRCKSAGSNRVWEHIPTAMDVHALRREYAQSMYQALARDTSKLSRKQLYITRDGNRYDRKAVMTVSYNLGHGRANVTVEHYLH